MNARCYVPGITKTGLRGFTLVELLVSASIFSFLILGLYGVLKTGTAVFLTDSTLLVVQQQARDAMNRIVREVRESKSSTVTVIDADSDSLTFSTPTKNNVKFYRTGNNLIREYPAGTSKVLATPITHLKFTKAGVQMTIDIQAQQTFYNRPVLFSLKENIKLRNE